ncbi:MAG: hypothetical protein EXR07_14580 [Acetobacteraceae bacterium]|nr:hypothetical protein [Acetobacteraceae bacterium]
MSSRTPTRRLLKTAGAAGKLAVGLWARPPRPRSGVQIYSRGIMPAMMAKLQSGQTIPAAIAWARGELDGFVR